MWFYYILFEKHFYILHKPLVRVMCACRQNCEARKYFSCLSVEFSRLFFSRLRRSDDVYLSGGITMKVRHSPTCVETNFVLSQLTWRSRVIVSFFVDPSARRRTFDIGSRLHTLFLLSSSLLSSWCRFSFTFSLSNTSEMCLLCRGKSWRDVEDTFRFSLATRPDLFR